jgi:hypothetical protein
VRWVVAGRGLTDPDYKTTPNEGDYLSGKTGHSAGFVNFSVVKGKTVEGDFSAELLDAKTKKKILVNGKFKGVDEQYGSKGFN